MNKRKKVGVCFIDDEPDEIRRFRAYLGKYFVIGAGTNITDALKELMDKGIKKPNLFVLDLYFPEGAINTQEELYELHSAREAFLKAQAEFLSVLARLRQTSHGGLNLAMEVKKKYGSIPYIFFTRKGTLEDALRTLDHGAIKIIKKPDPNEFDKNLMSISEAYDKAFECKSELIAHEIKNAIKFSTWWWRNKKIIIAFLMGIITSLLSNFIVSGHGANFFHLW